MYEKMVLSAAGVGSRKYRIAFLLIIGLMISISAFLMPVQVYAAGEALATLAGALAAMIADSAMGTALATAGVAAVIPEFASALLIIAIGLGVSITVYTLFQAVSAWWQSSGSVSDFNLIANAYNKTTKRIAATPFVFATIVATIKSQILGIEDTSSEAPVFKDLKFLGDSTWLSSSGTTSFTQSFTDGDVTYADTYSLGLYNRYIKHSVGITSGNLTVNLKAPTCEDVKLKIDALEQGIPAYDIALKHYTSVFTEKTIKIADSFSQTYDNVEHTVNKVYDGSVSSVSYINPSGKTVNISFSNYDSTTRYFHVPYGYKEIYSLRLKDGSILSTFDSAQDFAYKALYEAKSVISLYIRTETPKVNWEDPISSTTAKPVERPNILSNYNAKRDIISTTADNINKKIKTGDVTKDTAGSISIGANPTAVGQLTDTADVAKTKITDVAIPTQVEADKTAKEEADIDPPGDIGTAFRQGGDMIIDGAMTIADKFPFDVIKSAYKWLETLVQDGKPLKIDFSFNVPYVGSVPVKIDFSERQDVVTVINWLCIVTAGLGIILASREWLKAI